MSANNFDGHKRSPLSYFLEPPAESADARLERIEAKLDALHAALVKPQSSIILVGEDIARIAAELKRSA